MFCTNSEPVTKKKELTTDSSVLEEIYWARIDSFRMNFIQEDVDFMTNMIAHHAQALIMSRLTPENNADESIQTLAARIINAQDDEIATMQKWLRDRSQPVPEIHIDGLHLKIHMNGNSRSMTHQGMSHHNNMPGMLTQEQLDHLATLQEADFDQTFLEYMIEHHNGAVYMVKELFKINGAASDREAFELASAIHAEQITEIERMQLMLKSMSN